MMKKIEYPNNDEFYTFADTPEKNRDNEIKEKKLF